VSFLAYFIALIIAVGGVLFGVDVVIALAGTQISRAIDQRDERSE
jgi:hypothetical protein